MPAADNGHTIDQRLTEELSQVRARFSAELLSDLSCVNDLATHIERYRGKMLRPTLVLLCGHAAAEGRADRPMADAPQAAPAFHQPPSAPHASEPHLTLATVLEMVHMATLVHDDVLDEAVVRRRGGTINHLCGNEAAVMLGDYLISHAYRLCASLGRPHVSQAVAAATNTVCEGELLQLANRNNWRLTERTYFEIIRRKTASLCGLCGRLAARLSDAPPHIVQVMGVYGEKVGAAFQIIDDVLDLTGEPGTVGKTLGRDLQKGKLTLPLIRHLATATPEEARALTGLLDQQTRRPAGASDGGGGGGGRRGPRRQGRVGGRRRGREPRHGTGRESGGNAASGRARRGPAGGRPSAPPPGGG